MSNPIAIFPVGHDAHESLKKILGSTRNRLDVNVRCAIDGTEIFVPAYHTTTNVLGTLMKSNIPFFAFEQSKDAPKKGVRDMVHSQHLDKVNERVMTDIEKQAMSLLNGLIATRSA